MIYYGRDHAIGLGSAVVVFVILWCSGALGHEWYDPRCCNEQDCRPAMSGEVEEVRGGWQVRLRNGHETFVPYGEQHTQASPDGDYHVCHITPTSPLYRRSETTSPAEMYPEAAGRFCLHVPFGGI